MWMSSAGSEICMTQTNHGSTGNAARCTPVGSRSAILVSFRKRLYAFDELGPCWRAYSAGSDLAVHADDEDTEKLV